MAVKRPFSRRQIAWVALATWLIGFELGPTLHVALHETLAAHHHEEEDEEPEQDHPGADHPHHGRHSLAHHGVATLRPPTVVFTPAPAPVVAHDPPAAADTVPRLAVPRTIRSRGPPSVA